MRKSLYLSMFCLISGTLFGQLKNGPMVGYSEMREVQIWVQTEKANKVKIAYWESDKPTIKYYTDEVITAKDMAYSTKLLADQVLPSKKYMFEVYVEGKLAKLPFPTQFQTQTLWQYRADPPDFSFAVGSCVYINEAQYDRPGVPYGKGTDIFNNIADKNPNFMIWGGDNLYLREADWGSKTGINHRYTNTRQTASMKRLMAKTHNYAIWDDHDFGPNNSDRSFINKDLTLEAFKTFWANPNYAFKDEGVTGTFTWEDCQFFLMDDMYFRAPNDLKDPNKDYFGEKQLNWLLESLRSSSAPFKIIVNGGQIINKSVVFENMTTYPSERKKMIDKITEMGIEGVIFISGDRHHTNLQKLERENTYPLYELTVSPLTSGAGKPIDEEFTTGSIMKGYELYNQQNFGILEVKGKKGERVLTINVFDAAGQKKWDFPIKSEDLKIKK